jgi:ABC-type nitrate/sulfonate/bicarbonate transport system permease component
MYAGIFVGGIIGWLLNVIFAAASRYGLRWDAGAANRETP